MEGTPPAGEISPTDIDTNNLKQPDVSDEVFDHPCQPCLDEDKNIDSKKYCLECCEFLCETCVDYHRKVRLTKTHELITKTDVKPKQPKQLLDGCFQHIGKHIELFCESHNQLCCSTCKDVYHAKCDGVISIAEAASKVAESQELKDVVNELDNTQTELENVTKKREHDGERIESEKESALKALGSSQEKVKELFERLKLLNENKIIIKTADSFKRDIHEDIDKCNNATFSLNDILSPLKDDGTDDVERFIKMKRAKQNIISAKSVIKKTLTKTGEAKLVYCENSSMINSFFTFRQFGKLQGVTGIETITAAGKMNVFSSFGESFQIESICSMHKDDAFLITASINSDLNAIDPDGRLRSVKKFDQKPGDVCKLDSAKFALAFPNAKQVRILSVSFSRSYSILSFKCTEQHIISTESTCNGVAFYNSSIYIACAGLDMTSVQGQGYVDIYTTDAKHVRSITCGTNGRPLFCSPFRLASCLDSRYLYVLDRGVGLLKFNKTAENDPTVTKLPKFERGGIDVNENGHVFVLDYVGNKITLFGPNEVEVGPILSEIDGIVKPTAVMYTARTRKLYVALENCSELYVYDIVYDS